MIYVFGPRGYVGSNLIPYLEQWHEVKGIGRFDKWPEFGEGDWVVNCACQGWARWEHEDATEMIKSNAILPMKIHQRLNGAKMIHLAASTEWKEPDLMYSETKALASWYLKQKPNVHLLYIYTLFGGINQNMNRFMDAFIKAVKEGKRYTITEPLARRNWVHVKRLMRHIQNIIEGREVSVEDHIASPHSRSLIEVLGITEGILCKHLTNIEVEYKRDGLDLGRCPEWMIEDTFIEDLREELC